MKIEKWNNGATIEEKNNGLDDIYKLIDEKNKAVTITQKIDHVPFGNELFDIENTQKASKYSTVDYNAKKIEANPEERVHPYNHAFERIKDEMIAIESVEEIDDRSVDDDRSKEDLNIKMEKEEVCNKQEDEFFSGMSINDDIRIKENQNDLWSCKNSEKELDEEIYSKVQMRSFYRNAMIDNNEIERDLFRWTLKLKISNLLQRFTAEIRFEMRLVYAI